MKKFMQERSISAGQLAVSYKGRLVFGRSYAWTDDEKLRFGPTALFRIASLSKSITATAVNLLVQQGKLKLSTPVTELLELNPPEGEKLDPRVSEITVRRLLQHLAGWDRDISGDATFENFATAKQLGVGLPVGIDQIIRYGAGKPLDHDPGTKYAYCNYGYMLLGKIVEKVSGQPFEAFVKKNVLSPMGITRMRQGRTLAEHRAPTEVPYFSQYTSTTVMDDSGKKVPLPYGGFRLENFEATGGWLSSAVDMVRFASLFDSTKVLNAASVKRTFAEPETGINSNGYYYGMGWLVRPVSGGSGMNTWHDGSMGGTFAYMVRQYNGISWVALFNQRDDKSGKSYYDIDSSMWDAIRSVKSWPSHDLYDKYF
ncbi:serine hydrolase domain-containing protein [Nocardiopsis rhodophaea]